MRNSPLPTTFRATQNSNSLRSAHLTHPACQSPERGDVRLTLTSLWKSRGYCPSGDPNDPNFLQTAPLPANRGSARGLVRLSISRMDCGHMVQHSLNLISSIAAGLDDCVKTIMSKFVSQHSKTRAKDAQVQEPSISAVRPRDTRAVYNTFNIRRHLLSR